MYLSPLWEWTIILIMSEYTWLFKDTKSLYEIEDESNLRLEVKAEGNYF